MSQERRGGGRKRRGEAEEERGPTGCRCSRQRQWRRRWWLFSDEFHRTYVDQVRVLFGCFESTGQSLVRIRDRSGSGPDQQLRQSRFGQVSSNFGSDLFLCGSTRLTRSNRVNTVNERSNAVNTKDR
uniref:Uncharacterized protein n=1 Tax=Helianthus annuus TaxID=4232 RepID=A0A251T8M3_HELAN